MAENTAGLSNARRELWGYVVWGIGTIVVLIPEITAAADNKVPWPTISATVGHLEYMHDWIGLIVVGSIVFLTLQLIRYPLNSATATQTGSVTKLKRNSLGRIVRINSSRGNEPDEISLMMVLAALFVVGIGSLVASELDTNRFVLAYVLYGLIVISFVVVPSVLAFCWSRDIAFPTLFRTLADLERRAHLVAVLIIIGLVILLIHLALYPWPNIFHVLRSPSVNST